MLLFTPISLSLFSNYDWFTLLKARDISIVGMDNGNFFLCANAIVVWRIYSLLVVSLFFIKPI